MATNMSVLMNTDHPLWCMSAVDTSTYKYICPSCNSSAWSPIAFRSSTWHFHAFCCRGLLYSCIMYILQTSSPEQGRQHSDVCTWNASAVLYIYPNMMVTSTCTCFQNIDSIFCIATFFDKERLPWLMQWVVYNYASGD